MEAQQKISTARLKAKIGKTLEVVVDEVEVDVLLERTTGFADGIGLPNLV